jgi:hypothetical protein
MKQETKAKIIIGIIVVGVGSIAYAIMRNARRNKLLKELGDTLDVIDNDNLGNSGNEELISGYQQAGFSPNFSAGQIAQQLRATMKNTGVWNSIFGYTDEETLGSILYYFRGTYEMEEINQVFNLQYGSGDDLQTWIESDTSGDLRNTLIGWLNEPRDKFLSETGRIYETIDPYEFD